MRKVESDEFEALFENEALIGQYTDDTHELYKMPTTQSTLYNQEYLLFLIFLKI